MFLLPILYYRQLEPLSLWCCKTEFINMIYLYKKTKHSNKYESWWGIVTSLFSKKTYFCFDITINDEEPNLEFFRFKKEDEEEIRKADEEIAERKSS